MTIEQAFRNRGLLVHEISCPVYRVTFSLHPCHEESVEFLTSDWKTAREELKKTMEQICKIQFDATRLRHGYPVHREQIREK